MTSVLLERAGSGYSANYFRVELPIDSSQGLENTVVQVALTGIIVDEAASDVAFQGRLL